MSEFDKQILLSLNMTLVEPKKMLWIFSIDFAN
jgi:hypothetical protein